MSATILVLVAIAACTSSGNIDPGASALEEAAKCADAERSKKSDKKNLVCSRWACAHVALTAARWDGDALRCAPGMIDERARKRAFRLVNAYRFLAGVPEVEMEPRWDGPAQECALIAHANKKLSHDPPRDWSCWSDRGARASAVSLVANRSAPLAIDPFIEDPGNEESMVHRRWLLSEKVHRLGLGSTSGYTCALVDGREWDPVPVPKRDADAGEEAAPSYPVDAGAPGWPFTSLPDAGDPTFPGLPAGAPGSKAIELPPLPDPDAVRDAGAQKDAGAKVEPAPQEDSGAPKAEDQPAKEEDEEEEQPREWVAWPPPGPVPIDALERTRVDIVGWTIQSSTLDLDDAQVQVKVGGVARAINVYGLERTMGSRTAVRFVPRGWSTKADERYDVHVVKDDTVIDFTVEPTRCP